ncbi:MAG: pyridoxal kinase [Proteobacteria bacterium]|jgi:pyridoxine kinase|nr:pyridoxal kinase [Alphaproteobacteria bacterium]NCC03177.1 pyridoxal kinase [Pseudomonadota bacterium]
MSILSIQSHVAYGYVGNKAATYPLQAMGYDVWPVYTVQFSNHTGYGKWGGEIFSAKHILDVVRGIEELGLVSSCRAILSGYMGSREICEAVADIAKRFKAQNPDILYLCDPVIGNTNCFVKPEVLDFFKSDLRADIITPNQFEAETLSGIQITDKTTLKAAAAFFHERGTRIIVITGLKLEGEGQGLSIFASDGRKAGLVHTPEVSFPTPVNGTGDLFSALFLGHYLQDTDIAIALQKTTAMMQDVLQNTLKAGTRELQVLSGNYGKEPLFQNLPKLKNI